MNKIILAILMTLLVTSANAGTDFDTKTCVQFIKESLAAKNDNNDNAVIVEKYLAQFGLDKTDPTYWHGSLIVHCIVNKNDTFLDAVKQLVTELQAGHGK